MKISKKSILCLFIVISISFANKTKVYGDVSYYYMQRLSNQELVNIPFRMLNLNVLHQNTDFDVVGNFALEYRNRKDTDFMQDSNPVDINTVLRELYITYYLDNGEINIGKKIHTWGSVDENSPIDVINAYDNYYMLMGRNERKLGSYSLAVNYYVNDGSLKLSGVFSPIHNATRYPINDDDYEFGLPVTIYPEQILDIDKPSELGFSAQQSFGRGDVTLSYFNAYNRVPSFSGFNQYAKIEKNDSNDGWNTLSTATYIDLLFSYHKTEVANLGGVILFDDFTIRYDYGSFKSYDDNDVNEYVNHQCFSGPGYQHGCEVYPADNPTDFKFIVDSNGTVDSETGEFIGDVTYYSYPLKQKAEYTQQTFQVELPLSDNYQINMQYFKYKFDDDKYVYEDPLDEGTELNISNVSLPDGCDPNDLETCLTFIPGMGAPFSMLSSETFFINLEKTLFEDDLKISVSTLMDLDRGFGELVSIETDYNFGNGLNAVLGITKIIGDSEVDNYVFNELEDFSNLRFEIKYHF